MGYNTSATTLSLTAKLTPIGRQRMVSNTSSLIKTFSLGDSDANYLTNLPLQSGEVPSICGDLGTSSLSNSTPKNVKIKNPLIVNSSGSIRKAVVPQSTSILTEYENLGFTTISGSSISFSTVNRNDFSTDSKTNLFYSFGLPVTNTNMQTFTATTSNNGGFANTAFSGLATDNILVIAIDNSTYGEVIDGKTLRIDLPTSAGTYTIYSTYQRNSQSNLLDNNTSDTNPQSNIFGDNVSMLVSDDILTPNGGNPSLSWATGYNTNKPFSLNGKQPYNFQTNSNLSLTADTLVGIAYLDKGFIVITNPTIVNDFTPSASTATTISFNSQSSNVFQIINCIAERGEFGSTTNTTFQVGDTLRITEVGLYDEINNLIAYAKTDRQITKNINEFLALSIKINF
jgi:hypothetical protein